MSNYQSQEKMLRDYGILFTNVSEQRDIAATMAEYGYEADDIAAGRALYDAAQDAFDSAITEDQQETTAYSAYQSALRALVDAYSLHRKKAKVAFKRNPDALTNLRLRGLQPLRIPQLLDDMRVFYTTLQGDSDLLAAIKKLKFSEAEIPAQLAKVEDVTLKYAEYTEEKGESQNATKQKEKTFAEVEDWVQDFYDVARIAFEDRPQLLESIAKFVRS